MKNVIKILIIVFSIILIMGGGAFAYLYFATDVLKTDRQLFYKYISQNVEAIDGFKDESLVNYYTKKSNTPYGNNGKYKVLGIEEYLPENAKNLEVAFNGKTDAKNNYRMQQIKVNYNEDTSMGVELVQDGDYFGIKFLEVLKKYLTLENKDLKQFAKNVGMDDVEVIPDKIDLKSVNQNTKLSDEEITQLNKFLKNSLQKNISDEKFSSSKQENANVYTLNLTTSEIADFLEKTIDEALEDDLIKNRIKEIYKSQNNASDEDAEKFLEELKNKNDENLSQEIDEKINEANITINVYVKNKKIFKTELIEKESEERGYKIELVYNENSIEVQVQSLKNENYETIVNIILEKEKKQDELTYGCTIKPDDSMHLKFGARWEGIDNLENVKEQFVMETQSDSDNAKYVFTNNVEFVDNIDEKVNQNELKIINNYNSEQMEALKEKLGTAIEQLNSKKMEKLGIEKDENPLIYYLPFFSTIMRGEDDIYMQAKDAQITNKVERARELVKLDYMGYRTDIMQEQISTSEQISVTEYLKKHWTESSDPSLYTIKNGVITLSVPDNDGNYVTATYDEQERSLIWSDGKN